MLAVAAALLAFSTLARAQETAPANLTPQLLSLVGTLLRDNKAQQESWLRKAQALHPSDFWLNIGVAFPHKDTKGFNVMLQALPLNGKLVLRVYEEAPEESKTDPASKPRKKMPQAVE